MAEILKLPQFWIFMAGLMAFIRYSMKIHYLYVTRAAREKADSQMKVINALNDLVKNQVIPAIGAMDSLIKKSVLPALEKHELSISNMALIYSNTTDMMNSLKGQFVEFQKRTDHVDQVADDVVVGLKEFKTKISTIETEIVTIKDDLILVRTKK